MKFIKLEENIPVNSILIQIIPNPTNVILNILNKATREHNLVECDKIKIIIAKDIFTNGGVSSKWLDVPKDGVFDTETIIKILQLSKRQSSS